MKPYLKTIAYYLPLPFILGAFLGWLYPSAGQQTQDDISNSLTGFGNVLVFELLSILSIIVVSIYVLIKGQVSTNLNKIEKAIVYWLPATALGFVVPFFAALYGFIWGHPPSEELKAISIMGTVGFIWSAGFLVLVLAPAHRGVWPKAIEQKRQLYGVFLFSAVVVSTWQFLT